MNAIDNFDSDNFDSSYEDDECDAESLASLEDDDQRPVRSRPERILAELPLPYPDHPDYPGQHYLIKWDKCPLLDSSWELEPSLRKYVGAELTQTLLEAWEREKQLQREGKTTPFHLESFRDALATIHVLDQDRRNLRRWKRQLKGIRAAIAANN